MSGTDAPIRHIVFYSDSVVRGGAEQALGLLLSRLGPRVRATVMGVDREVVDWLADKRPGTASVVLPSVRTKWDLGRMWAHRRAIASIRPDVFQANLTTVYSCQYALLMALTVPGVRVVALEHSPLAGESQQTLVLKRLMSRRLAAHVSVGHATSREVERVAGLRAGSIRTIHNAVTDEYVRFVRPSGLRPGRPVIGSMGRLERLKGYDVLLRAAAPLDADLIVAGEGAERPQLLDLAERLGMSGRLRLSGWLEHPRDLLAEIDVFALPSRMEGLPLVVLEAMLAGLPVVATRVGSTAEAVDDATGILVEPDDVDGMRYAIEKVLADPSMARQMGQAGRAKVLAQFSATRMVDEWEALYDEVTARPSPP